MKPFHGYQICPVCGSEDLEHVGRYGISSGTWFTCKECGYKGPIIEFDTLEDVKETQEYLKTHKDDNVAPTISLPNEYSRWLLKLYLVSILIIIVIVLIIKLWH